jgi:predicted NACHT family NTPase
MKINNYGSWCRKLYRVLEEIIKKKTGSNISNDKRFNPFPNINQSLFILLIRACRLRTTLWVAHRSDSVGRRTLTLVQKLENYMQERFLVSGKAGSGKTHLVLQKFLLFFLLK